MKLRFVSSRDAPTLAITTNQNLTPKAVSEGVRNFVKDEQPRRRRDALVLVRADPSCL